MRGFLLDVPLFGPSLRCIQELIFDAASSHGILLFSVSIYIHIDKSLSLALSLSLSQGSHHHLF